MAEYKLSYTGAEINEKLGKVDTLFNQMANLNIPTKTSELTNDSGFLTSIPSEYVTETELNAKKYLTSVPSEYITETELSAKNYLTSIPSEYVTETELNNKGYATQTEVNQLSEEIADQQAQISELGGVPQAITNGASALVNKALSRADGNALRFLISADEHQSNDHDLVTKGNIELGQAYGEILKLMSVDFVSSLGDNAWGAYANTTEEVREQLKQFNKFVKPYIKGEQELNCEGNHDDSNYSMIDSDGDGTVSSTYKLSQAEIFSLIHAKNKDVVYDIDHYLDGYCYKDFEHLKTRVICLNAEQGTGDGGVIEGYQLKWFAETALNMSGKTDWSVITLAHHPLDYPMVSLFRDAVNIIEAFINGSNLSTTTNDGTAISINYSGKNCQYVGHFHGHTHAFSFGRLRKYANAGADSTYTSLMAMQIGIPNACYMRTNQNLTNSNPRFQLYSTETSYTKSDVDGQRTSFNLVTIDLDNKVIYADNFGAGIDRIIPYGDIPLNAFTITRSLLNCTSSSNVSQVTEGGNHTETLTCDTGYTFDGGTVKVTMGGVDITSSVYSNGAINITNITGDIAIIANAAEAYVPPVDVLNLAGRTYVPLTTPQFIATTEAVDMDSTKCYALYGDGRRGQYPSSKFTTFEINGDDMTWQVSSSSGYGMEFPVDLTYGKTYTLNVTMDDKLANVYLVKRNSDTTYNSKADLYTDGKTGTHKRTITPESGYKYSIYFVAHANNATQLTTLKDVSVIEN